MNEELKILINGELNRGKTIGKINEDIKFISKKIKELKINLGIDQKFIQAFIDLNKGIASLTQSLSAENKVTDKFVDGQTKAKNAINEETEAINKQVQAIEKLKKVKTRRNGNGEKTGESITTGDKFNSSTENRTYNKDGSITTTGYTDVFDADKLRRDTEQATKAMDDAFQAMFARRRKEEQEWNATQKKAIYENADLQRKQDADTHKARQDYEQFWLKSLNDREQKEIASAQRAQQARLKLESAFDERWQKNLHKREELELKQVHDLDKAHSLALIQNDRREQDFLRKQDALTNKIESSRLKFGHHNGVNDALDSALVDVKGVKSVGDYNNALKNINSTIDRTTVGLKAMRVQSIQVGDAFKQAMVKFPIWMAASTAFFLPLQGLTSIVSTIVEIDDQMTQLNRVMDNFNMDVVLGQSVQIADDLAQKITDVNAAMISASRMGLEGQDMFGLARVATLASTISDLSVDEALDNLSSTITQFHMETSESINILDQLNAVDNETVASTKNLSDSIAKAGSVAQTFGISLQNLLGYTVAVSEATRESGSVIGTSIKSWASRITTMDKVVDALKAQGVNVFDPLTGEVRRVDAILEDLSSRWDSLGKSTQQSLAVIIAGRNHVSRFAGLMNNFASVSKTVDIAMQSQGSSMQESEKYQKSLTAQLNLLNNSWTNFAITVGDEGLKSALSGLITSLTSMMNGFTDLTVATDGWNIKLPLYAAGVYGLAKALTALSVAGKAAKLSLAWVGVGLIAVEMLASMYMNAGKSAEMNTQAFMDSATQIKGNADQIQGLIDKHDELQPLAAGNTEKQQELHAVLKQINDIAPQLIDRTKQYGDAMSLNKQKANEYVASLREMSEEQLNQAKLANAIESSKVNAELQDVKDELINFGDDVSKQFEDLKLYKKLFGAESEKQAHQNYLKMIESLNKEIADASLAYDSELVAKKKQELTELYKSWETYKTLVKSSTNDLADYSQKVNDRNGLEQQKKLLDDQGKAIEDQIAGRVDLGNAINDTNGYIDEETGEWVTNTTAKIDNAKVTEELSKAFKEAKDALTPLNQALADLSDGQSLSSETVADLILQYPTLANSIKKTADGWIIEKGAIEDVRGSTLKLKVDAMNAQMSMSNAAYAALSARLAMYDIEIDKIQNLQDAMNAANKINTVNVAGASPALRNMGNTVTDKIEKEVVDLGKAKEQLNALSKLLQDPAMGTSGDGKKDKSSKGSSQVDELFRALPEYEAKIKDIAKRAEAITKEIESIEFKISAADAKGDIQEKIKLEQERNTLLAKRRDTYHEIADSLRVVQKNMQAQFNKNFGSAFSNKNFSNISQQEIKSYTDAIEKQLVSLNNQLNKTDNDGLKIKLKTQIDSIESKKDLFSHFTGTFEEIGSEIAKQSEQWTDDYVAELTSKSDIAKALADQVKTIIEKAKTASLDELKDAHEKLIDQLKSSMEEGFSFDDLDLSDSIDNILSELDLLDNNFIVNVDFNDNTNELRSNLSGLRSDILSIADAVKNFSNDSSTNQSDLQNMIQNQIGYAETLKNKIADINDQIRDKTRLYKQVEESMQNQIDLLEKERDRVVENYQDQIKENPFFDVDKFLDDIRVIEANLQSLNLNDSFNLNLDNASSTGVISGDLKTNVEMVLAINREIARLGEQTVGSKEDLNAQIEREISLNNALTGLEKQINDEIRDRELLYKQQEEAKQKQIDDAEKQFNTEIDQQQERLKLLDEQYNAEDRLQQLRDIDKELADVKGDKRFSYIDAQGNEILTFNKERADELQKERDDMVKEFQREDIKKAINAEIDRLEKAKEDRLKILQDELKAMQTEHQKQLDALNLYLANVGSLQELLRGNIEQHIGKLEEMFNRDIEKRQQQLEQQRQIHQAELDSLELYRSQLETLQNAIVEDTQKKIDALAKLHADEEKALEDHWSNLLTKAEEGTLTYDEFLNGWQTNSLNSFKNYVDDMGKEAERLKTILAQMNATKAEISQGSTVPKSPSPPSTPPSSSQKLYLENLVKTGNKGVQQWASEQLRLKKYHTGGEVGKEPLKPDEIPSILKKGEYVFTEQHLAKMKQIFLQPANIMTNFAAPNGQKSLTETSFNKPQSTDSGVTYQFHGDINVKANNPTDFLKGIDIFIKSHKK